jgi:dimethylargininase
VSVNGCLHLKTAVTMIGPDRLLVNPAFVDQSCFEPLECVEVDPAEQMAGNALRINETVIFPSAFPRTAERLEKAGVRLVRVDADELAKAEGGVTCCSLLFRPHCDVRSAGSDH